MWGVKHFRPYLFGRHFKIVTDHKPLIYLFNLKDPSSRLLKFKLIIEEYDYEIETQNRPKEVVELRFIDTSGLEKLRKENELNKENNVFIYSKNTIFIQPAAHSQMTRAEFVKALSNICSEIYVKEVYFIKNRNNDIFVEKLISQIGDSENWLGHKT